MEKYILVHKEDGVFVGSFLGLSFWSKLDDADQVTAPLFNSKEETIELIKIWDTAIDISKLYAQEVFALDSEKYIHKSQIEKYW